MNKRTIPLLLGVFFLVLSSCTYELPNAPENTNPFDPDNPDSGGDPYNIRVELLSDGFRIVWDNFSLPTFAGFTIFRQVNDGPMVELTTITDTVFIDTDDIMGGTRYFYKIAANTGSEMDTLSEYNCIIIHTDPIFTIEDEAPFTQSRSVNLSSTAFAAETMRLTNDPADTMNEAGWEWQDYQSALVWPLETGVGDKSVYLQVCYDDGTVSNCVFDTILPLIAQADEFIIAASEDTVQSNVVDVILRAQYADDMQISSSADFAGAEWVPYDSTFQWNLGSDDFVGDGIASSGNDRLPPGRDAEDYSLYARVKNSFEVNSVTLSGGVVVEIFGSAFINQDDEFTPSPEVMVNLQAPQASMVALSNSIDEIESNPAWVPIDDEIGWTLLPGDGIKTVYVRFKNQSGAESQVYSDTILPLPIGLSMEIIDPDGDGFTSFRTVDLSLSAAGVDLDMLLSESPDFTGAVAVPFETDPQFVLSEGSSLKTVYVKVTNPFEVEAVVSDAIEPAPMYPVIEINSGAYATNNPEAQLAMPDVNALEMMLSSSENFEGALWVVYQPDIAFNMPVEITHQTVYAKFRHEFFETGTVSDTILLDMVSSPSGFTWSSSGGNPHFIGDTLRFELVMADDDIGPEVDGYGVVTIQDVTDAVVLTDQGDGSYTGEYLIQESDFVRYGNVSVDFTDRGGNVNHLQDDDFIHIHAISYYWNISQTNIFHTINVQAGFINEQQLEIGDRIGAFTTDGVCAGVIEISDRGYPIRIYTYGDYEFTDQVEGFTDGEEISFRVWDQDQNLEMEAEAFDVIDGDLLFHDRAQTSLSVRGIVNGN